MRWNSGSDVGIFGRKWFHGETEKTVDRHLNLYESTLPPLEKNERHADANKNVILEMSKQRSTNSQIKFKIRCAFKILINNRMETYLESDLRSFCLVFEPLTPIYLKLDGEILHLPFQIRAWQQFGDHSSVKTLATWQTWQITGAWNVLMKKRSMPFAQFLTF